MDQAGEIFIPSIVLGELYYGAHVSQRVAENLSQIAAYISDTTVLDCNIDTASAYAVIKSRLRAKGRLLPENDIWIAATSSQHDLHLVTRDAHFSQIADLEYSIW